MTDSGCILSDSEQRDFGLNSVNDCFVPFPIESSPCRHAFSKQDLESSPQRSTAVDNCTVSSTPRMRVKKLHMKPTPNILESPVCNSPNSTMKMESLASQLVKNIFKKRSQTPRRSSPSKPSSHDLPVPAKECPFLDTSHEIIKPLSPELLPSSDALTSILSDDEDAFRLESPISPMSQRLRRNFDAIYSMYRCGRRHTLQTETILESDDGLFPEQYPNQSCAYNFLPLSWFSACSTDSMKAVDLASECNYNVRRGLSNESVCSTILHFPVLLHSPEELSSFPSILTDHQMLQLRNDGLPPTVKLMSWIRAYSLQRDGDCFESMVKHLSNFRQTLVVIQTTHDHILGGYSDIPWVQNGDPSNATYVGGRVFLFANKPAINGFNNDSMDGQSLRLFHWNGKNNILRMSSMNRGCFGMGDGDGDNGAAGAFGWFIQNDLSTGITAPCASFDSPALTTDINGIFSVKALEVWGFLPMLTAFHQSQYQLIRGWKRSSYVSPSDVSVPF